ncbi:MAG: hypothetical protein L0Z71_01915 [Anaerolineae bacterium]|nr:hypothetical protein [Anaerolineae bacterium]
MSTDRKYMPLKESRGWYFVEYHPPASDFKFANLHLVITIENARDIDIADAMEKELKNWLNRYPIPLFFSAFDNKGDLIHSLNTIKGSDHLIGFFDQDGKIRLYWRLVKDNEIPDVALNKEYVNKLYSNLDYKTYAELDAERRKRRKEIKTGSFIIFVWLVIIPLLITVLEFYSNWLALITLIYSFYKAIQTGLELRGKWPKSKRKKAKELEERLKDHYYYHCQMNPEGFKRLMLENLEKMGKDEIAKEAELLKTN